MSEYTRTTGLANAISRFDEWTCPSGRLTGGTMSCGDRYYWLTLKHSAVEYRDFRFNVSRNGITNYEITGFVPAPRSRHIQTSLSLSVYQPVYSDESRVKISDLIALAPETGERVATLAILDFIEWQCNPVPAKIISMHNTIAGLLSEYARIEPITV